MAIKLPVSNPLALALSFRVAYSGPEVLGPPSLNLEAGASTTFTCYCAPLLPGRRDASIALHCAQVRPCPTGKPAPCLRYSAVQHSSRGFRIGLG